MSMQAIKRVHNGAKVQPTFSIGEMQRRRDLLVDVLETMDVAAALLTSIHNVNYFADFLYCAFGRRYALAVTPEGQTVVAANIDGGQPWRRAFADCLSYTDWADDNFFKAVRELLGKVDRLGVEFDHMTMQTQQLLEQALPGVELVDVGEALMRRRMIKSAEEIGLIRQGAQIADLGGAAAVEAIAEGVPEHEIALHATAAMVREIARRFPDAELRDTWTWFQSGLNTDGAHNPVTSRRLRRGDILSLNCFPMIAGYYTALERTLFLGEPSDEQRRVWEINCSVHRCGLELIRPGARCCDIARGLNEIYDQHGLLEYRSFGYGHSFGVLCHYYGREAGLELREDVVTRLEPGMVVSMEPMVMIPQGLSGAGGYREHDILVVTEQGAENVTGYPFGSEHNILAA